MERKKGEKTMSDLNKFKQLKDKDLQKIQGQGDTIKKITDWINQLFLNNHQLK